MRRPLAALALAGLALFAASSASVHVVDAQDAAAALRSGDYETAIARFTARSREQAASADAHRALARVLAEVGRYREAEEVARGFVARSPRSPELWNTLGELFYLSGRLDDAESAFEKAIAGHAADALVAEVNLAVVRFDRGERDEARKGFRRLVAPYNPRPQLSSEELAAVGTACRYLGTDDPQLFKDALKAFDEAIAADPDNLDARVRLAELFLEKYNGADAAATAAEALERNPAHPRALLAMARVRDFDGATGVLELVKRSLEVNPRLAEARVFQAEILIAQEDFAAAARRAEEVLADNPASLPALSVLAAARYLQEDRPAFEEARKKVLLLNPRHAEFYNTVAEVCVRNRLYAEAVSFAGQAVGLDGRSWRGFGILGLNQLRIGRIDSGRKNLEASFAGDPYNVWIKNTLDLLDTFPQYEETRTAHFHLLVHGKESALLSPYLAELAEEAYERLADRYRFRPPAPIRVEVYPSHGDFSVRTVGLAGLGALGVCFGSVLALDSPSAREIGQFNWGSTLWHELAHTVTLGVTANEVPRWLGEGLSVLEERRARPGWGDDLTVELLKAYREGRTTAEAFQGVLATTLDDFDRGFFTHLNERFAGPLSGLPEFE